MKSSLRQRLLFLRNAILVLLMIAAAAWAVQELLIRDQLDVAVDNGFQADLMNAIDTVKPGENIDLQEGRFYLNQSLLLETSNVRIRGAGAGRTILSFKPLPAGKPAILIRTDNITFENITIADAPSAAMLINKSRNIVLRNVEIEMTPTGKNRPAGRYGIASVSSGNLLIEKSAIRGASATGLYVLNSDNVVLRENRLSANSAAVTIASSRSVDIEQNTISRNGMGVLMLDLPEQASAATNDIRLTNNQISENNRAITVENEELVQYMYGGTGVVVLGVDNIELNKNKISRHDGTNVLVLSRSPKTYPALEGFDPYAESIFIVGNRLANAGDAPSALLAKMPGVSLSPPYPDVLYDGVADVKAAVGGKIAEGKRLCLSGNNSIRIANLDRSKLFGGVTRRLDSVECTHRYLNPVILPLSMQ